MTILCDSYAIRKLVLLQAGIFLFLMYSQLLHTLAENTYKEDAHHAHRDERLVNTLLSNEAASLLAACSQPSQQASLQERLII